MEKEGLFVHTETGRKLYDADEVREFIISRKTDHQPLIIRNEYTIQEISKKFHCSEKGRIIKSNTANALILIIDHNNPKELSYAYADNKIMYEQNDEPLNKGKNRYLISAFEKKTRIHIFESFFKNMYRYKGTAKNAGDPVKINFSKCTKWFIPLAYDAEDIIDKNIIKKFRTETTENLQNTDINILKKIAEYSPINIISVKEKIKMVSPYAEKYAMIRSQGKCDLCGRNAPFTDRKGNPYLETYVLPNGQISMLCPECHAKLKVLHDVKDMKKIEEKIKGG